MSDADSVLEMIEKNEVQFVDFRFTDPRGKWQHMTQAVRTVDEDVLTDGIMFDGSSIAGWKEIHQSDMVLMPDPASAVMDPFSALPQMILTCDVIEPSTGQAYDRCPRCVAKKAEIYLAYSGLGDTAYFGPEAEFFVFDDVRFKVSMNETYYMLDQEEGPYNSGRAYEEGNYGHRPPLKGGYVPVPPVDSMNDMRAEMVTHLAGMGVKVEKHHHEVAPSQNELGVEFGTLLQAADQLQIQKYVVQMTAHSYGKSATFMPKPIVGDNGSGMHVHQSIWKDGKPLFAGSGYADLSDMALYYIGGVIKPRAGDQRLHQPVDQQLQAARAGLRGAGAARLLGAQPLCVVPHPLRGEPQGQARRGALPRSLGQPLSGIRRHADGGYRRHREQDPSRRRDGQEPLRPAAGGAQGRADGVRQPGPGAGFARRRP